MVAGRFASIVAEHAAIAGTRTSKLSRGIAHFVGFLLRFIFLTTLKQSLHRLEGLAVLLRDFAHVVFEGSQNVSLALLILLFEFDDGVARDVALLLLPRLRR